MTCASKDSPYFDTARSVVTSAAVTAVCRDPLAAARINKATREKFAHAVHQDLINRGMHVESVKLSPEGLVTVVLLHGAIPVTLLYNSDDVRVSEAGFGPNLARPKHSSVPSENIKDL